jgi:signal transduction histidine kinase
MRKVIRILFENALEAMQGKPGRIDVRLYQEADDAVMELEDSGEGIEPQHLPFIFDPFFTTKPKALGMGLTKAKRIIAKHGGRLLVEPAEPRGTRVRLSIPMVSCDESVSGDGIDKVGVSVLSNG